MPSPLQWRRARAIHSLFKDLENVDSSVHQLVFAFCDCPPQVFSNIGQSAFALLTDWGAVVTWGSMFHPLPVVGPGNYSLVEWANI